MLPLLVVAACEPGLDGSAAQKWINAQEPRPESMVIDAVPGAVDTPPGTFSAKVFDPFDPARVSVRTGNGHTVGKPGVVFPDAPISALSIVGFITGASNERVVVIRQGAQYRSVRKGNRIGEQAALVLEIDEQGLLLDVEGVGSQWLLRQK